MISADSSTWIGYLQNDGGRDTELLDRALRDSQVLMTPAVLAEVLSDHLLAPELATLFTEIPLIAVEEGYWSRAGELRARLRARGRKARLGDALIAQSCIDRAVPLLTRDSDFLVYAEVSALQLLTPTPID